MKIYNGYKEAQSIIPGCAFAIGNFDGVHLGHRALLRKAQALASALHVPFGVYTFWPHPQIVLHPNKALQLICTREQKIALLKDAGVEHLIEEPFTFEFAQLSAQRFSQILSQDLDARAVVVGENFRFGHGAKGTAQRMQGWLKKQNVECAVVSPVMVDAHLCSSSSIRALISQGDVAEAGLMLGRNYAIVGTVVKGSGRGSGIGVPTANLKSASSALLSSGVYATFVRILGHDKVFAAATNIGTRPTFSGDATIHIESHILDFATDIYGKAIEIFFVKKIRDEHKFESSSELVKQIGQDIAAAKEITALSHF